jgi:hypothetical protein
VRKQVEQEGEARRRAEEARREEHGFQRPTAPVVREVEVPESISVGDLARACRSRPAEVIKQLFKQGMMVTINQDLDRDTAMLLVEEMGHKAVEAQEDAEEEILAARKRNRTGRASAAPAGRDHHGPRRPRQDLAARLHPPRQGGGRRGRRHHPAHRRLPRRDRQGHDLLPRHPGPRRVLGHACPRRPGDRHRHPGGGRRRRRHAADQGGDPARQGIAGCRWWSRSTRWTSPRPIRTGSCRS